jgi:hypothetical protein
MSTRRLLTFAVLEALAEAGWTPKGSEEEMSELKDDLAASVATEADTNEG